MPGNRMVGLLRFVALLVAVSLPGCTPPPPDDEAPTPREVRKKVEQTLKERPERVILDRLDDKGEGRYAGTAQANLGGEVYTYTVEVKVEGRWLHYTANGTNRLGEGNVLSGIVRLSVPPFRERHYELMQWLRAIAFVVQGLAVVWAVLGRFGFRRLYSPRVERVLVISAAINLGFAMMWGYEFYTNLRAD
jgi:hypothetical protein